MSVMTAARPLTPSRLRSSRILERQQRLVGNRFDEAGAEQRDRRAPRDHVRVVRNDRLAGVGRDREHLEQRLGPSASSRDELAVFVAAPGAHLGMMPAPPIAGTL